MARRACRVVRILYIIFWVCEGNANVHRTFFRAIYISLELRFLDGKKISARYTFFSKPFCEKNFQRNFSDLSLVYVILLMRFHRQQLLNFCSTHFIYASQAMKNEQFKVFQRSSSGRKFYRFFQALNATEKTLTLRKVFFFVVSKEFSDTKSRDMLSLL